MVHGYAGVEQIVGDDSPMAAPPDGFRTHDRGATRLGEIDQFPKAVAERVGHCVVGVVVEALVLPKRVLSGRCFAAAAAQAPERGQMLVSDTCFDERRAKR